MSSSRPAGLLASLLIAILLAFTIPAGALRAQMNNSWQIQQQRQHEMLRQQQMQQEQMRRQQQEQLRQQQRQQLQAQQRQQMQAQQRQQMQAQQRQTMQQQQQQVLQQQQRNRLQKQQIEQAKSAQQVGKPPPTGTPAHIANKPTGPMVFSNGVARLTRPLTPAEISRGFTGKVTPNGRALIKFQGRIFAVPASRVSGLTAKLAAQQRQTRWTAQQRGSVNEKVKELETRKVVVGGSGGRKGPPFDSTPANDNSKSANRVAYASFVKVSGKDPHDLFRHARGWDFSKPIQVKLIKAGTELCQWQAPGARTGSYFAPCGTAPLALGISDQAKDEAGNVVHRIEKKFTVINDIEVLEGTAAKVVDDWSIKGQRIETQGGGRQYLIKDSDVGNVKGI